MIQLAYKINFKKMTFLIVCVTGQNNSIHVISQK